MPNVKLELEEEFRRSLVSGQGWGDAKIGQGRGWHYFDTIELKYPLNGGVKQTEFDPPYQNIIGIKFIRDIIIFEEKFVNIIDININSAPTNVKKEYVDNKVAIADDKIAKNKNDITFFQNELNSNKSKIDNIQAKTITNLNEILKTNELINQLNSKIAKNKNDIQKWKAMDHMEFLGKYSTDLKVNKGDIVTNEGIMYLSLIDKNKFSLNNNEYWEVISQLKLTKIIDSIESNYNLILENKNSLSSAVESITSNSELINSNFNSLKNLENKINEKKSISFNGTTNSIIWTGNYINGKKLMKMFVSAKVINNKIFIPLEVKPRDFITITGGIMWSDGSLFTSGYGVSNSSFKIYAAGGISNNQYEVWFIGYNGQQAMIEVTYTEE